MKTALWAWIGAAVVAVAALQYNRITYTGVCGFGPVTIWGIPARTLVYADVATLLALILAAWRFSPGLTALWQSQTAFRALRDHSRRFSLRTALLAVTVFACWLGWQMRQIHARQGFLRLPTLVQAEIYPYPLPRSTIRQWLGDQDIHRIEFEYGFRDWGLVLEAKRLFPDASLTTASYPPFPPPETVDFDADGVDDE